MAPKLKALIVVRRITLGHFKAANREEDIRSKLVMLGAFLRKKSAVLHSADAKKGTRLRVTKPHQYPVENHPRHQLIPRNLRRGK
jgi:hypothetical protein